MKPLVASFFEPVTMTFSHIVYDAPGGEAAIVDPVLDYDPRSGRTCTLSAQKLVDFIHAQRLSVTWLLETHAHADHLSAAPWLQATVGGRIAIGAHIREVQAVFGRLFNLGADFATDGRPFDQLFNDGDTFRIGALETEVLHVPGHTPADVAYRVGDAVFVGDTLFMPDVGSARCDFPGGDAATLYRSARRLLALPDETRLFMCHDYPPAGRGPVCETTVGASRSANLHLRDDIDEARFVALRHARDRTLPPPALMLPSVQVNIRAGHLPPPEDNGQRYLKIPLNLL